MAINYNSKMFYNIEPWWQTFTAVLYCQSLTLVNVGTVVNCCGIFITLGPVENFVNLFVFVAGAALE